MEGALEGDHGGATRVEACELDGVLDGFRASVEEGGTRLAHDRDERAEPLGELHVGLVGHDREVRVDEALRLLGDRLEDARVRVTGVEDADAAYEVDEHVAVDVRERGVLGALGEDRQVNLQWARDGGRLAFEECSRARPGDLRTQLDRPRRGHEAAYPRVQKYIRRVDAWLESLDVDPLRALAGWLAEAFDAGLFEPEAAALATSTRDGVPSVRMVIVRGLDERGLRFYTNLESRKALELDRNPRAALVFNWGPPLRRQARIEGATERLSREESAAYFRTRERASRLGAWASPQSRPLADRDELDRRYAEVAARFADVEDVPLPSFWGGYLLVPDAVELWQNRPSRLHERARYERSDGAWRRERLAP